MDASLRDVVDMVNGLREGFVTWMVEENKRDRKRVKEIENLREDVHTLLDAQEKSTEEFKGILESHASSATSTINGLTARVQNIELIPQRVIRILWGIVVSIVIGVAANVGSNYVLHRQTQQQVQAVATTAQQAVTVTAKQEAKQLDAISNAVGAPNAVDR